MYRGFLFLDNTVKLKKYAIAILKTLVTSLFLSVHLSAMCRQSFSDKNICCLGLAYPRHDNIIAEGVVQRQGNAGHVADEKPFSSLAESVEGPCTQHMAHSTRQAYSVSWHFKKRQVGLQCLPWIFCAGL